MRDRLDKFMKTEGLVPSRFAEIMGVQPSSISHILGGRNKPSFDFIEKMLLRFPKINPDWLLLGKGSMYRGQASSNESLPSTSTAATSRTDATEVVSSVTSSATLFDTSASIGQNGRLSSSQTFPVEVDEKLKNLKPSETNIPEPGSTPFQINDSQRDISNGQNGTRNRDTTNSLSESITPAKKEKDVTSRSEQTIRPELLRNIVGESRKIEKIILFFQDKTFSIYTPETENK